MAVNHMGGLISSNYMFMRSNTTDMGMGGYTDMLEKRQLFLRSYQFSRKKSMAERIKRSFFRVKRVICARLRSARKLRKVVWLKLRYGLFYNTRRKFFLRLNSSKNHYYNYNHGSSGLSWPSSSTSSCF